jgi:hypothetical protein
MIAGSPGIIQSEVALIGLRKTSWDAENSNIDGVHSPCGLPEADTADPFASGLAIGSINHVNQNV